MLINMHSLGTRLWTSETSRREKRASEAGSAVGVARAATRHRTRTVSPARRSRAVHPDLRDDVGTQLRLDQAEQLAREHPQLGGPRGRLGLQGQLAVAQADRPAVRGDLGADEPVPRAEHGGLGRVLLPAPVLDQALDHASKRLWVSGVRTGAGVALPA